MYFNFGKWFFTEIGLANIDINPWTYGRHVQNLLRFFSRYWPLSMALHLIIHVQLKFEGKRLAYRGKSTLRYRNFLWTWTIRTSFELAMCLSCKTMVIKVFLFILPSGNEVYKRAWHYLWFKQYCHQNDFMQYKFCM